MESTPAQARKAPPEKEEQGAEGQGEGGEIRARGRLQRLVPRARERERKGRPEAGTGAAEEPRRAWERGGRGRSGVCGRELGFERLYIWAWGRKEDRRSPNRTNHSQCNQD